MVVTTVDIDPGLLARAKAATGEATIKGTVAVALARVVKEAEERGQAADWRATVDVIAGMRSLTDLLDPEVRTSARR